MQKRYLLIMALLLLGVFHTLVHAGSSNGWIYQNPYPTSNTLLAVKFITPKKGWLAGEHGTILYTEDGGETWEAQESWTEADIKSLTFINEKQGWGVGNYGVIIHTEDGGKTWVKQGDIKASLHIIFFINEKDGWAGGSEGTLLHTKDGGKNWGKQDIKAWADIAGIFFKDANTGWVLSGASVFRTSDGGKNWESSELPSITLPGGRFVRPVEHGWEGSVFFLNENKGFITIGLPYIFYTEDGGKTWQATKVPNTVERVSFTDEKSGCAAGTSILCTEDGGKTWKERLGVRPGESDVIDGYMVTIWGLSFVDKSTGWAVGKDGQIWKTEEGGKSWRVKNRNPAIGNIYFIDTKTGWATTYDYVHDRHSIVKTDDGGNNWKVQKEFDNRVDIKFFFIDSATGWAVGQEWEQTNDGAIIHIFFILHTHNSGKTWVTQFKESVGKRQREGVGLDVFFINSRVGWAVGANGLILHTKDGGKHWVRQKSGTKFRLRRVRFVDDKRGWAIGDNISPESGSTVIILHTDNGGRDWRIQWKKSTDWIGLRELQFIDSNTGWAGGDINEYSGDWLLVHTTDGGKTWTEMEFNGIYPESMFFLDKNRGVIITDKGQMLLTRDGGKTWNKQRIPLRRYPWHVSEIFKVQ